MKRCQACRQYQALDQFYRHQRHADGLMHECKACQAVKACTTCHRLKPLEAFYAHSASPDGHQGRCKACAQRQQKAFCATHPERMRQRDAHFRQAYAEKIPARQARWRQAHPGKSQEYEATRRARKRRAGKIEPIDRTYLQQGIQILALANKAYDLYLKQPHEERTKLLQFLLLNSTLKDGNLCVTYRKPFNMLANGVSHQQRRPQGDLNPCCRRERPVS